MLVRVAGAGSALPNLSQCSRRGRTGECLEPPLNRTVPGKHKDSMLRGADAAFWPKEYLSKINMPSFVRAAYPFDESTEYEVDYNIAMLYKEVLYKEVEPTTIPLVQRTQTLYHWTDQFPSATYLPDGEQVLTYGFTWTSTAKEFTWPRSERLEIVLPKGANVEALIDPKSQSRFINCNGEKTETVQEEHHNDVVLQPSVFRLRKRELDLDLIELLLQMCIEQSDPPGNIESFERVANQSGLHLGWHVKCKQIGQALNFMWREREGNHDLWKKVLKGSVGAVPQQEGLLFVNAAALTPSPVLEWVGNNDAEPPEPM